MSAATHPAAVPHGAAARRVPTRRNTELGLLLLAWLLVLLLSVTAQAALTDGQVGSTPLVLPIIIGFIYLGAHLAVRFLAPYADPVILPCAALINGIGVIFIQRLSIGGLASINQPNSLAQRRAWGAFDGLGHKQLYWMIVAIIAMTVVLAVVRDHRILSRYAYTLGLAGLVFMAIPAILPSSLSSLSGGAKLWIILPGIGAIQPSEFAKLLLFSFFAFYLVNKREVLSLASKKVLGIALPRPKDLGPVIIIWAFSLLILIFEKDLGTSLMYFGTFVVMMYIATERTSWLIIGLGLFLIGAFAGFELGNWLSPFANLHQRVELWLHPTRDPLNTGFQPLQAHIGLAAGGLLGTGPGAGHPTLVPLSYSDYITAGLGEELGLVGLIAILMLYLLIAARGMKTAVTVRDPFGKLLAGGLAFSLALQVFVIVGGVTGLIPLTGLTTPLLSYGGSSLVANWVLVGLLLRISSTARQPMAGAGPAGPGGGPPPKLQSAATEVIKL
jgi:cell division protein FtsW (lipid II flippase)